jgi:hypothetical protein
MTSEFEEFIDIDTFKLEIDYSDCVNRKVKITLSDSISVMGTIIGIENKFIGHVKLINGFCFSFHLDKMNQYLDFTDETEITLEESLQSITFLETFLKTEE